jgi:hypothetical protein
MVNDPSGMMVSQDAGSRKERLLHLVLTLAMVTLALRVRKYDSLVNPQFWAEDATIFFQQQWTLGWRCIFEPYAGYLHLVPRLVAFVAYHTAPPAAAPIVYNYSSLLLTLAVAAHLFSARFRAPYKPLFALAMVLAAIPKNEVFLTITNVQWILCLALVVTLLKESPDRRWGNIHAQFAGDLLVIVIIGLSGPFIILLAPLFVWRRIRRTGWRESAILAAVLCTASIQIYMVVQHGPDRAGAIVVDPVLWSTIVGRRFGGLLFFGLAHRWIHDGVLFGIALLLGVFLIAAAVRLARTKETQGQGALLAACMAGAVLLSAAAVFRNIDNPAALLPILNAPRYFYIPYVLIAWCLIVCLSMRPWWFRGLAGVLLVLMLVASLRSHFRSLPLPDKQWARHCSQLGSRDLRIPINPGGWSVWLPAALESVAPDPGAAVPDEGLAAEPAGR